MIGFLAGIPFTQVYVLYFDMSTVLSALTLTLWPKTGKANSKNAKPRPRLVIARFIIVPFLWQAHPDVTDGREPAPRGRECHSPASLFRNKGGHIFGSAVSTNALQC